MWLWIWIFKPNFSIIVAFMLTQNYDFLARKFKFTILNFSQNWIFRLNLEFSNSVGRLWEFRTLRCNDIDARIVNSKTPPCFNFQPFEEHEINKVGSVISGAVITSNGKLTPGFEYIQTLREENESTMTCPGDFNSEKKVNGICIVAIWRIFFNFDIILVNGRNQDFFLYPKPKRYKNRILVYRNSQFIIEN